MAQSYEARQTFRLFVLEGSNLASKSKQRVRKALAALPGYQARIFRENSTGPFYQVAVGYSSRVGQARLIQALKSAAVVPPALRIAATRDVAPAAPQPEITRDARLRKAFQLGEPQTTLARAIQIRDRYLADGLYRFKLAKFEKDVADGARRRQELSRLATLQAQGRQQLDRALQSVADRATMERLGGSWFGATGLAVFINQLETDDFDGRFGEDSGRWSLRDDKLCFQREGSSYVMKYQYRLDDDGKTLTLRQVEFKGPKMKSSTITLERR